MFLAGSFSTQSPRQASTGNLKHHKIIQSFENAGAISRLIRHHQSHHFSIVTVLLALIIALAWIPVRSDVLSCVGSQCTGSCLPEAISLDVRVTGINGNMITFCVSVSGKGYNYGGGRFTTSVYAQGYPFPRGGCANSIIGTACLNCQNRFSTTIYVPGSSAQFWTKTYQFTGEGYAVCVCSTAAITVPVTLGDTTDIKPAPEELGPTPCESQISDPISAFSGNVYNKQIDIEIPSDKGLFLQFARHYNSADSTNAVLGHKWRLSYQYDFNVDSATGNVTIAEPTGRRITFLMRSTSSGTEYLVPWGIHYQLAYSSVSKIYTLTLENDSKYHFDSTSRLTEIQDRNGNAITMSYSGTQLSTIENSSGRALNLGYVNNKLDNVTSDSGDTLVWYDYNLNGTLKEVTYPDNAKHAFWYGSQANDSLSIVNMANSDSANHYFTYDGLGRAVSTQRKNGYERKTLTYKSFRPCCPDSFITKEYNPSFNDTTIYTSHYSNDYERRYLRRVVNPNCDACGKEYIYGPSGEKIRVLYQNNVSDSFDYDIRGNMIMAIRGANTSLAQETRFEYLESFHLPTKKYSKSVVSTANWDTTYYEYDNYGNLTRLIESGYLTSTTKYRDTTRYYYNGSGQMIKMDGPRSDETDTTSFVYYDSTSDLRYIISSNGDTTRYGSRNEIGQMTWVVSPNGDTTRYGYDDRGRLAGVIRLAGTADSTVFAAAYDFAGNLLSAAMPGGDTLAFHYNTIGYLDSISNPLNAYIRYAYDSSGNPIDEKIYSSTGTSRKQESFSYNKKNQLVYQYDPYSDTTRFGYSPVGTIDTLWDALSKRTVVRRDSLGRIQATVEPDGNDSIKTLYYYDTKDNITKVTDPSGYDYQLKYDDKSRLIYDSSAVTGITRYGYDKADNLIWQKNAANDSIAYKYDGLDRLTAMLFPDSQNIRFKYDAAEFSYGRGRLYMDSTGSCWIKYQYNEEGLLYKEIRKFPSDTGTYVIEYHYDKNENLDTLIYPTGRKVAYTYDDADNVIQIRLYSGGEWTTMADSIKYAPFGQAESWILGNGIKITLGIDSSYRQDSISTAPDSVVRLKYTYNAAGNISQVENYLDTLADRNFTYDDIYRLTEARSLDYPDTLIKYVYADNGNREKVISYKSAGVDTALYNYSGNKLNSVIGTDSMAFTYDAQGNVARVIAGGDTMTFQYNDAGMLTGVDSGNTGTYSYDAQYRRIKKVTAGSTVTKYIPNEFGQILTEYAVTAGWERDYIYLNGQPIARVSSQQGEGIQYVISDHLGAPVALVDENKTIRWKAQWYPFGELYDEFVSSTNEIRFPGQWEDDETGLYYNWHRYYGPATGRYYQSDPIGLDGGAALYLYAGANPIGSIDPFGLYSWAELGYDVAQAAVGFGDNVSFGLTRWIRSWSIYGGDCFTDSKSIGYNAGDITAFFVPIPVGKIGLIKYFKIHAHHMIPQQFEKLAYEAGINVNDYIKRIPVWKHILKPFGIHTGPDHYNKAWKEFFNKMKNPTRQEILTEMDRLNEVFGLKRYK
jgi:RHS repeat-associated protein